MKHTIRLFFILLIFWLLSSGHNSPLMLSLGLGSIILVLFIVKRMDQLDHEVFELKLTFKLPLYLFWLLKEVCLSNILVIKCIWSGNHVLSPALITVWASQKSELGKVIYANSISMTPGTITVDLVGDKIMVHAISNVAIDALLTGEMDQRITQLEK